MVRSARRRWRPLPWGLALILLAYVAGGLGDALHWLTTAHRLCEVHGRIEHVASGAPADDPETCPGPAGPLVRSDFGAHEGCGLGGFASTTTVPVDLPAAETLPLTVASASAPVARFAPRGGPRFALAPSRSPPRA
jgi:hypothetical protein